MKRACPSCGFENIAGSDRCEECFHSLMQIDLPKPSKSDPFQKAVMTKPVSDLLTGKDLLVANENDSVEKVVRVFQEHNLKCILIYREKKMVGILSNRDIIQKAARKDLNLAQLKVRDVMTPNPEYVKPDDPIAVAVNKMALGGFRNLPVLSSDGAPLSIITIKDVLSFLSRRHQKA